MLLVKISSLELEEFAALFRVLVWRNRQEPAFVERQNVNRASKRA